MPTSILSRDDRRKAAFMASMAVQIRRRQGMPEPEIKADALGMISKVMVKQVPDQVEQESWLAELQKAVDREIERTRPGTE